MANKYCDHGLYGSSSFTGTITSTTALNVTALASGSISLGQIVTGTGIPANTYISALGTGTGGTGTYTLSQACTNAAGLSITGTMGGFAPVPPTWGVAQEGDGTATGAATPATVSIDMTSMTAAAGNTISIGGAVLTCVASGATTNQFNAGSGATLVSNLVTAINRTTNTNTVQAAATGWSTPKLQDAVYARVGTPTTTLDIMYRAGSATHNANSLAQVALSGFTGGGGPYTFSGGAGGAWGQLFNPITTILPSAVAAGGYGVWGAQQPLAGVQSAGDNVYLRANNKTILVPTATSSMTVTPPALGSVNSPVRHIVDDGTAFTGDSSTGTLVISYAAINNYILTFNFTTAVSLHIIGKKIGTNSWSLKFQHNGTAGSIVFGFSNNNRLDGFNAEVTTSSTSPYIQVASYAQTSGRRTLVRNGMLKHNSASGVFINLTGNGNSIYACDFENLTLDNGVSAALHNGLINATVYLSESALRGIKCTNFVVGSKLFSGNLGAGNKVTFYDSDFGNVTVRSPYSAGTNSTMDFNTCLAAFSGIGNRDFLIDNVRGTCVWSSAASQPTLNAVLPDGSTKWSWRIAPATGANYITAGCPLVSPRIVKLNTLASGARTFTLEFCVSNGLSWTARDVSMLVQYTDAGGNAVTLDTWDYAAGALTTSSSTWSQESGGQVTYSDGGTLYHNKKKLSISTPTGNDLPLNAEVSVYFRVHNTASVATQYLFVDPDVGIA